MAVEPSLNCESLRKLRPRVELQPLYWGKARALATEQKRNVHLAREDDAIGEVAELCLVGAVKRLSCKWKGQTVADEEST